MEPWEKLIRTLTDIWAEEDIKAGYYKVKEVADELADKVRENGEKYGDQEQSSER